MSPAVEIPPRRERGQEITPGCDFGYWARGEVEQVGDRGRKVGGTGWAGVSAQAGGVPLVAPGVDGACGGEGCEAGCVGGELGYGREGGEGEGWGLGEEVGDGGVLVEGVGDGVVGWREGGC